MGRPGPPCLPTFVTNPKRERGPPPLTLRVSPTTSSQRARHDWLPTRERGEKVTQKTAAGRTPRPGRGAGGSRWGRLLTLALGRVPAGAGLQFLFPGSGERHVRPTTDPSLE